MAFVNFQVNIEMSKRALKAIFSQPDLHAKLADPATVAAALPGDLPKILRQLGPHEHATLPYLERAKVLVHSMAFRDLVETAVALKRYTNLEISSQVRASVAARLGQVSAAKFTHRDAAALASAFSDQPEFLLTVLPKIFRENCNGKDIAQILSACARAGVKLPGNFSQVIKPDRFEDLIRPLTATWLGSLISSLARLGATLLPGHKVSLARKIAELAPSFDVVSASQTLYGLRTLKCNFGASEIFKEIPKMLKSVENGKAAAALVAEAAQILPHSDFREISDSVAGFVPDLDLEISSILALSLAGAGLPGDCVIWEALFKKVNVHENAGAASANIWMALAHADFPKSRSASPLFIFGASEIATILHAEALNWSVRQISPVVENFFLSNWRSLGSGALLRAARVFWVLTGSLPLEIRQACLEVSLLPEVGDLQFPCVRPGLLGFSKCSAPLDAGAVLSLYPSRLLPFPDAQRTLRNWGIEAEVSSQLIRIGDVSIVPIVSTVPRPVEILRAVSVSGDVLFLSPDSLSELCMQFS